MTANEVRIGNFIEFEDGAIIQVKGIHPSGKYFHNEKQSIEVFRFKPIPLTEEWLRGFGFSYISWKNCWNYTDLNTPVQLVCVDEGLLFHDYFIINHVHTLQNLFYCLCGHELSLKGQ